MKRLWAKLVAKVTGIVPWLAVGAVAWALIARGGGHQEPGAAKDSVSTSAIASGPSPLPPDPAPAPAPHRIAVIRAFTMTPRETLRTPPSEEPPPAEPTARYASLNAVRDTVEAILMRALPLGNPAVHWSREPVQFRYHYANATTVGWAVHVTVTDTTDCPNTALEHGLEAAGWAPHWGYGADGADGSDMGYVTREYLCVIEASWVGGDESDTTYVPPPGCEVTVTCVPRRMDDVSAP